MGALQLQLDERGAAAIEYGLIASLIAIACVGTIAFLGQFFSEGYFMIAMFAGGLDSIAEQIFNEYCGDDNQLEFGEFETMNNENCEEDCPGQEAFDFYDANTDTYLDLPEFTQMIVVHPPY